MDMNIDMAWSWNHNLQSINRMPTEVRYICPLLRVSCLCLPACLSFFAFVSLRGAFSHFSARS